MFKSITEAGPLAFMAVAVFAYSGLCAPLVAGSYTLGPRPRLDTASLDRTTDQDGEIRLVTRARALLASDIEVPEASGDWIFYYACPEHNTSLVWRDGQHTCPVCDKVYDDMRTHRAWITQRHNEIDRACLVLAQAWRLSGETAFAAEAWRILRRYAELTPGWPRHDRWGRRGLLAVIGGKRYAQSLDDAYGIIFLARAYDLIAEWSGIPDDERRIVERDLFRATADSIYRMYLLYDGKNNHMTWFNAAVATVGVVLGDANYLDRALNGAKGLRWQLTASVTAEGLWYEGALAYHYYALDAVMMTLESALAAKADVGAELETTRQMFRAPLALAYPNGVLPAINDSDRASLAGYRHAYQRAATIFDDPDIRAFAAGEPLPQRPSEVFTDAGLAYLRQWGDDPVTAMLVFGQHGGHHGHPDKLNLLLFAAGRELFPDIGRLTYRCAEYETWARQTVAHNTVVLGRRSQRSDDGVLLAWGADGGGDYVVGESRGAYRGAVLRRAVVLLPRGILVDLFRVEQRGRGHAVEWVLHGSVPMRLLDAGALHAVREPLGRREGYQHILDVEQVEANRTVRAVWQISKERNYTSWLLNDGTTTETIYTGNGIGFTLNERLPMLIRHRPSAPLTLFAAVHAPDDRDGGPWQVESRDDRMAVTGRIGGNAVHILWDGEAEIRVVTDR